MTLGDSLDLATCLCVASDAFVEPYPSLFDLHLSPMDLLKEKGQSGKMSIY